MKKKKKQILDKRRIEIINLSKDLIIKHGWNDLLFKKIHENKIVNIKELDVLFLNGYREMIRFFFDNLNKKLEDKNKNQNFLREPVHKRIRKILISKLEIINKDICHEAMYDRETTWPKESLRRLSEKENN